MYAAAEREKPVRRQIKTSIEVDFKSLSIEPIWVNLFEDIAEIFKNIRNKNQILVDRTRRTHASK